MPSRNLQVSIPQLLRLNPAQIRALVRRIMADAAEGIADALEESFDAHVPVRTGRLRDSLQIDIKQFGQYGNLDIRFDFLFYGRILDFGGKHSGWLDRVVSSAQPGIVRSIAAAVENALKETT